MELKFQKNIDKINGCPSKNEEGNKTLYRFVTSLTLDDDSFEPQSIIHKPKFDKLCKAWGLSTYDTLNSAIGAFKSLPKKRRETFLAIAVSKITDNDGVKYSTKNKNHYTFFPKKELNLLTRFAIVKVI